MTIQQRSSGAIEILTLAGRLTLGEGCGALREAVIRLAGRKADPLVDLSGIGYIDSAGLGELVACFHSIATAGREMKSLRPAKRVDSMLHITKLLRNTAQNGSARRVSGVLAVRRPHPLRATRRSRFSTMSLLRWRGLRAAKHDGY